MSDANSSPDGQVAREFEPAPRSDPTSSATPAISTSGGRVLSLDPNRVATTPAVAANAPPAGKVLPLDMAIRCEPGKTARSTCYLDKLARLSRTDQRRVEAMENLLFDEKRRAGSCQPGELHLPDSKFSCPDGNIWYHFSADRRLFILSYFDLNARGGGMTGAGGKGLAAIYRPGCRRPQDWGEGIAARLAQLFAADWSRAPDIDLVAWLAIGTSQPVYNVRIGNVDVFLDEAASRGKVLVDIAASCYMLREDERESVLPTWSLLRLATRAPEQLENPYARAIFAGEALCKIGFEIGNSRSCTRALRWTHKKQASRAWAAEPDSTQLLRESAAILGAIRDGSACSALKGKVSHYLTSSFMDEDMLADLRRLALIRNEMTFRLAMAVARNAARVRNRVNAEGAKRDVLRRYAMLSEFVHLSATYFGVSGEGPAGVEVVNDLAECAHKKRNAVKSLVRDLDDFGSSTLMIVDILSPRKDSDAIDVDVAHAKLCGLASEILAGSSESASL